jgi:N-acylneuraminate cytidylyltransferase
MIAWSIETARASGCFARVIVSTDDEEIAEAARAAGADVPFRRPAQLADDHAGTGSVIAHAVDWIARHGTLPEAVACIYPTAPLLIPEDVWAGRELLAEQDVDFVVSVTPFAFPIQRGLRLGADERIEMLNPALMRTRSQDLEPAYHDAGALYWGRAAAFSAGLPIFGPRTRALRLPRNRAIDIDTPEDWLVAEAAFRALRGTDAPAADERPASDAVRCAF